MAFSKILHRNTFASFPTAWYGSGTILKPRFHDPRDKSTLRQTDFKKQITTLI